VQLLNSEITTAVQGVGGDAGNLTLDAPFVLSEGSRISANAFDGRGGNIRLGAEVFLADPASFISASSTLGIQGMVDIRAPVTTLSGAVAPLAQAFLDVVALLPVQCAALLRRGLYSSLVVRGRDGLPPQPDSLVASPLMLDDRAVADLMGTGVSRRQMPPARFSLLTVAELALPRLQGPPPVGKSPGSLAQGCL
jgi:hypothetical protein